MGAIGHNGSDIPSLGRAPSYGGRWEAPKRRIYWHRRFCCYERWAVIRARYAVIGSAEFSETRITPRFNISPTQEVPIVRRGEAGNELAVVRWGLIPFWSKDAKIASRCINARSETVAEKPAFRAAWRAGRRCLIPASGFYEWDQHVKPKQPYLIRQRDGEPMTFAGLWERWKQPDGTPLDTCTILTTAANAAISPLHDRMPVMLSHEAGAAWIDARTSPDDLARAFLPDAAPLLETVAVSSAINRPSFEGSDPISAV